jgi:DNA-binding winged helix-turn-helix (wHTH) protein
MHRHLFEQTRDSSGGNFMSTYQQRTGGVIGPVFPVEDALEGSDGRTAPSIANTEMIDPAVPTILAFGPFRLDAENAVLFREDKALPLGQRPVTLLLALLKRAGLPVSKEILIDATWPALAVEESNLTVQIAAIRRVLGEEPGGQQWIETLPRRGYRYVGPRVAGVHAAFAGTNGANTSELVGVPANHSVGECDTDPCCSGPSDNETGPNAIATERGRTLGLRARACSACGRPRVGCSQRRLPTQSYRYR